MSPKEKATITSQATATIVRLPARAYDETEWSGRPNYTCRACGFVTLDLALMTAHIAAHQPVAAPPAPPAPRPFGVLPDATIPNAAPDVPAEEGES